MGKSIGFKVIMIPIFLGLVYIATILCDIAAIKNIGQKSDSVAEVYLELEKEQGSVEVAFEQTKLYANLCMIFAGQEMGPVFAEVLSDDTATMQGHLDTIGTLCRKADSKALTDAYSKWQNDLNTYSEHIGKVLTAASSGDAVQLGAYVGQIEDFHEPILAASLPSGKP